MLVEPESNNHFKKYSKTNFFFDEMQLQVYIDNYWYENETFIESRFETISEKVYELDNNTEYKTKLYNLLVNKKLALGGRILSNLGINNLKNVSPFNCYASQRNAKPVDSMECIFQDLKTAANILKTEGGIGFNFSHLRPKYTYVKGSGIKTPGVVGFMEIFDKTSEIITRGTDNEESYQVLETSTVKQKARKGACISMLEIWHPDILEYIQAKKSANKLVRFNMSVAITDHFMTCVLNDSDWHLIFPDIHFSKYDEEWDGDIDKWQLKGYPVIIYKTIKARELWDIIIKTMYTRNEPGMWFIDNANKYNNTSYYQKFTGTNPCGEISMCGNPGTITINGKIYEHLGDICNLGSVILCNFYDKNTGFNWDEFKDAVDVLVRSLDNIIDIANYPLEGIKNSALLRRKIGCGFMGYASLLMMMGIKYGSPESIKFTEQLMSVYVNQAYQSSSLLAKEKGTFLLFDKDKIINCGYIRTSGNLNNETLNMISNYGLRNSQLLTVAPNGNSSVLFGNVSSGIEPSFGLETVRWITATHLMQSIKQETNYEFPDIESGQLHETKDFKWKKEGDEELLISVCGNYKIDKHRGLIKRYTSRDYGYNWCLHNLTPDELEAYKYKNVFSTAMELTAKEHLDPFITVSKYVDNSISKTINLKEDYPINEFSDLFVNLWKNGCRGVTTYRENTMTVVVEQLKPDTKQNITNESQEEFFELWTEHNSDLVFESVKLPDEYAMQGYTLRVGDGKNGKKWRLFLAFKDKSFKKPFAIFAQSNVLESNITTFGAIANLIAVAKNKGIPQQWITQTEEKITHQKNIDKLTRVVGLLLRHNIPISDIINALESTDAPAGSFVYRLGKFLHRFAPEKITIQVQKCCPNCQSTDLIYKEGCISCSCGWTKC